MLKSRFFHRFLTGSSNNHVPKDTHKWYKYAGYSVYIEETPDGLYSVTHTMCGRKEKNFSKKKAREVLRAYRAEGKNTEVVSLLELPNYLAKFSSAVYGFKTEPKAGIDELRMAFKFVK